MLYIKIVGINENELINHLNLRYSQNSGGLSNSLIGNI